MATEHDREKPKKNHFIGYPRILARQPIKDLTIQYDEEMENRAETSATSATRHRGNIPNKIFSDVVGGVIEILKTNPSTYQRQLDEKEVENIARAAINLGNLANRNQFSQFILKEVFYLMEDLVDDMFKSYQAKEKEVMDDSSDEEDDVTNRFDDKGDIEADWECQIGQDGETTIKGAEGDFEGEDCESEGEGRHEGSDSEDD